MHNAALTTGEIKHLILVVQSKKTDYNTKLTDHNHDKCIITPEVNTLADDVFNSRLVQANLIAKTGLDAKLSILHRKITSNNSKHLLVGNKLKKLKTFDSSYFRGKSYFKKDGTQSYLVFQPMYKYLQKKAILTIVQNGILKDCLMKLLNLLIIVSLQHQDILIK